MLLPPQLFLDYDELYLKVRFDDGDGKGFGTSPPINESPPPRGHLVAEVAKIAELAKTADTADSAQTANTVQSRVPSIQVDAWSGCP